VKSSAGEDRGPCAAVFGVDAFTDWPFGGNPAMVCLLPEPAGREWMQRAAAELNQPATAFLHGRRLRWFTPTVELPLCGHGTLAAAHVLYEAGLIAPADPIVFETASGPLRVWRQDGLIWIGFAPVAVQEARAPRAVVEALNPHGTSWFGRNEDEYVLVLDTAAQVEAVRPDLERIRRLPVSRVLVTAAGGDGADFTSRNFAPVLGLDEDQATGSAHAVLGPLWAGRLGRRRLSALQASPRRGRLAVAVEDDRVHVGGHAITITRGEWFPDPVTRDNWQPSTDRLAGRYLSAHVVVAVSARGWQLSRSGTKGREPGPPPVRVIAGKTL
jgi:predicted PhzF superfamily epimerase YddE/YHI9